MTRAEHMKWCKDRALAYLTTGDTNNAFASLLSDLGKHPETADHPAKQLGTMLALGGHLGTTQEMREFIEGCN